MAINQITGNGVNTSTHSSGKGPVEGVDKSRNSQHQGQEQQSNPYSDQVSISGRAGQLERLSKELLGSIQPETQIGDMAHKFYEYGFISLEHLNRIPLETRSQPAESAEHMLQTLQSQTRDLALQGEDSSVLEGLNKFVTALRNMTAPSYPTSAYQRVSGYGYIGIQ